jgi:hypothetical protein
MTAAIPPAMARKMPAFFFPLRLLPCCCCGGGAGAEPRSECSDSPAAAVRSTSPARISTRPACTESVVPSGPARRLKSASPDPPQETEASAVVSAAATPCGA